MSEIRCKTSDTDMNVGIKIAPLKPGYFTFDQLLKMRSMEIGSDFSMTSLLIT